VAAFDEIALHVPGKRDRPPESDRPETSEVPGDLS
jgi:hypothetical protein